MLKEYFRLYKHIQQNLQDTLSANFNVFIRNKVKTDFSLTGFFLSIKQISIFILNMHIFFL